MLEHDLACAYRDFLLEEYEENGQFVIDEFHYLNANTSSQGLQMEIPLHPIFISQSTHQRYHRFGELVGHTLQSILQVLLNPHHSHCSAVKSLLGVEEEIEDILRGQIRGPILPGVIRPDTVLNHPDIKAHEINVSWPGGIADTDIILNSLFENTLFTKFRTRLEEQGVGLIRPQPAHSTNLLIEALLETADMDRPYMVLIQRRPYQLGSMEPIHLAQWMLNVVREQGYDCDLIYADQVEYDGHKATFEGRVIDVAYRYFEWPHVLEDPGFLGYRRILAAAKDGNLAIVNSFVSEALSAKSVFELIWDDDFRSCFHHDLIEEMREFIPRTFNLLKASDEDLEHITATKDSWVIKPVKGSCGMKVFLGRLVEDHGFWHDLLYQARAYDFMVAQEYVQTPATDLLRLTESGLVQDTAYLDINPFFIHGRMGHYFSRWSRTYMTAQCGPGMGGMFPVVVSTV